MVILYNMDLVLHNHASYWHMKTSFTLFVNDNQIPLKLLREKEGLTQKQMPLFRKQNGLEKLCDKTQLQHVNSCIHLKHFLNKENDKTYDQED